jgi:hypothetical protein
MAASGRLSRAMLDQRHAVELDRIERADGGIVVQSNDYPSGYLVHTDVH